jgi:formylglycine-generating enzyme required for sulfatase activity
MNAARAAAVWGTWATIASAPLPAAPPEAPGAPPAPFTQTLAGTAQSFQMVPVPGGQVTLHEGAAERVVEVAPFFIAVTETTWDLYDVFVFGFDKAQTTPEADAVTRPSRPYVSPDRGFGHAGYAAISLTHMGAEHYCKWLSAKTGRRYRLPAEAEWSRACLAGGVTPERAEEHAWALENAERAPHPVARRKPDALGVHDLWGNVMEWCTGADGKPVAMGGSFRQPLAELGCSARAIPTRAWQETDPQVPKSVWWLSDAEFAGFRVVCEMDGGAPSASAPPAAPP